jgi:hypothetical protein
MAKAPAAKKPRRMHKHPERELRTLEHIIAFALELELRLMAVDQTVTDALAAQDQKLSDLSKKVDDFIASHQSNSAADNASIVSSVQAQGTAVDAISSKLTPPTV